jgi:hypothetical protein
LKKFNTKNPQLEDFEEELKGFSHFDEEVALIQSFH